MLIQHCREEANHSQLYNSTLPKTTTKLKSKKHKRHASTKTEVATDTRKFEHI